MKILKDSLIYLVGEMLAKAMPFLLLPYLTRKLGTAGFGELSYYQAAFSLLLIGFGMSQDGAVTRYYYVYGQRNLHSVVYAGALYTAFAALIGLLAAWQLHSLALASVVCAAAAQTVLATQLSLRQCRKQALAYTAIQFGSSLFTTVLTVWLLEMSADYPVERRFWRCLPAMRWCRWRLICFIDAVPGSNWDSIGGGYGRLCAIFSRSACLW